MRLRIIVVIILYAYFFPTYGWQYAQAQESAVPLPETAGTETALPGSKKEWVDACTLLKCGGDTVETNCSAFAANPLKTPEGNYYCLTVPCGTQTCYYVEKKCNKDEDCAGYGQYQTCSKNYCYLDEAGKKKFESQSSILGITADLQVKKPVLEINIPQLKFSEVQNTVDEEGYIHIPYIGEYITAVYKVGMVVASILAVIMIVVQGVKITTLGGEARADGFKKIGQIIIGLTIAWGSYAILYNINPNLTSFTALKIKYIEPKAIPDFLTHGDDEAVVVPGKTGKKHGEPSGQLWTIPGTSIQINLSAEDVCALNKLGKTQAELEANITTVTFLGSKIKVHKFIANDLQERFKAIESSSDPAVVNWVNHLKNSSQHIENGKSYNPINSSGAFMNNGHGSAINFIKRFGAEVGVSVGKGGLANTALANYIKLKLIEKSGSKDGTYVDKNGVTRKLSPSSIWIASAHALGIGFDIDYPHNQTFEKRTSVSIPDAVGNILEATGKFVWLRKADPAHIEYAPSLCD